MSKFKEILGLEEDKTTIQEVVEKIIEVVQTSDKSYEGMEMYVEVKGEQYNTLQEHELECGSIITEEYTKCMSAPLKTFHSEMKDQFNEFLEEITELSQKLDVEEFNIDLELFYPNDKNNTELGADYRSDIIEARITR